MSPQATQQNGAVKLIFDPRTRLPGERIEGVVELDIALARKEGVTSIGLKLRGVASTRISGDTGDSSTMFRGRNAFLKEDQTLWQGATHSISSQGTATSSHPFHFVLPEDLPSSFHDRTSECVATISYAIEVVAERPGLFSSDWNIGQVFPVIAPATKVQLEEAEKLAAKWDGEMTTSSASPQVRRMIWGEYSSVEAQITHPAISSFPVGIPIPVSIEVSTRTKLMSQSEASEESLLQNAKKPIFPVPPSDAASVRLWIDSHHHITVQVNERATIEEHVHPLGGFGSQATSNDHVVITQEQPAWISDNLGAKDKKSKGKGRWERKVRFDSTITLACSPTMDVGIVKCAYLLHFEAPFPGMGNNLHLKIPIHVNSGVAPFHMGKLPPYTESSLPPAYLTGEYHQWDAN